MKLHCHRPSLTTAFQVVGGVVPSRTPKEILQNVKLEIRDGVATLSGTDLEVGVRYEVPGVEADGEGAMLLSAQHMLSILREIQGEAVDIEATEQVIRVRSDHSDFRLAARDVLEFPDVPTFDDDRFFTVDGRQLQAMIRRTIFATDQDSARYALGGLLMEFNGERLSLVATDSRRLALTETNCEAQGVEPDSQVSAVVPAKAMSLMERSIEGDEPVRVAVRASDVVLSSGRTLVFSRVVEGRFPRYRDVIPREEDARVLVTLVVGPLHSAVRQAQIVTDDESRGVDFTFGDGMLRLTSQAADIGESEIEVPIEYNGEELTIRFDPKFVVDFLRVLDAGTEVRLGLSDAESAAVFRTDDAYTYVIMPLSRER